MEERELPVLDEGVLDELAESVGGDRDFVVELIDTYLTDAAQHVAEVEAAIGGSDATGLVRPAHTLKSSSATLGAARLAATARRLEMAGRAEALGDGVRDELAQLRDDWAAAETALRSWRDGAAE
jgi:HPt (histidine-containing phosphotransfer) domain-containing protein